MASKSNKTPGSAVNGPSGHGLKGIVGAERAASYSPSSYGDGDRGGAAGGYGVGHGYSGASMCFEGGVRGGGVSERETMPTQQPVDRKHGFDERDSSSDGGTTHGVDGVEGMETGASSSSMGTPPSVSHGYSCPHGCGGDMKSKHGLARHVHAKHGGFGGLGKAFNKSDDKKSHGTSYGSKVEYKGETEGSKEWEANEHEWKAAKRIADSHDPDAPHTKVGSKYK